ncbi:MAG: phosphate/phosphite/phosphonate ABC transporter substrate-binding protein [Colwellia sp.]|nr:phosphate/phosphite/phosphonate ABC transporter substrate-binding protein [Colwellia sp.]
MNVIQIKVCFLLSITFIFMSAFCAASTNENHVEKLPSLTVGSISNTPKEEVRKFQPFIDHLVASLTDSDIKVGRVIIASSLQEMSELINQGLVDIYIDSPFPIMAIQKKTNSTAFIRRWKKGVREYNSVIFARKDSGIKSLNDLTGKMISFEESFSTSGYFLPKATLLNEHYSLIEKRSKNSPVAIDKIGYIFSYDDETSMVWVLRKKVAAAALSKKAFNVLSKSKRDELIILQESLFVPRQIMVHRPKLSEKLIANIKKVLLNMHNEESGRKVLLNFSKTKQFETFNNDELKEVSTLFNAIESEFH